MGPVGMPEMVFIFILALVLFGPKKLPELGRLLGRGLTEFRRAKNELKTTFESHMHELEREANLEKEKSSYSPSSYKPDYSTPRYPYSNDEYGQDVSSSTPIETTAVSETPAESSTPITSQPAAVNGTVARSNGTQPVEHVAEAEHRPA